MDAKFNTGNESEWAANLNIHDHIIHCAATLRQGVESWSPLRNGTTCLLARQKKFGISIFCVNSGIWVFGQSCTVSGCIGVYSYRWLKWKSTACMGNGNNAWHINILCYSGWFFHIHMHNAIIFPSSIDYFISLALQLLYNPFFSFPDPGCTQTSSASPPSRSNCGLVYTPNIPNFYFSDVNIDRIEDPGRFMWWTSVYTDTANLLWDYMTNQFQLPNTIILPLQQCLATGF